jgi:tRNA-splicing ligase RtcB (3'-phosphate/5'-hydroxy nucleic acid ligase)
MSDIFARDPARCSERRRHEQGDLPPSLRAAGQPVLIPGSMGTASYVLTGVAGGGPFHSTCHGAGRTMSRHAAKRRVQGATLRAELDARGIAVRAR